MRSGGLLVALLFTAATSRAEQPRATAVELFTRGRALAQENKCQEALPFFLDTIKLEPSVGALLNLAECYEKLGDASKAFARYHDAEVLARDKRDDRESLAHQRWQALAARMPKILVVAPAAVEVRIDGEPATGVEAVAPGDHEITATGGGRPAWVTHVLAQGDGVIRVQVPELASPLPAPEPQSPSPPEDRGHMLRLTGIVVTVTGAAALIAGAAFGGAAIAYTNQAQTLSTEPNQQNAFNDARTSAKTFADTSTVLFVAGGVAAALGLTLWLVAPRSRVAVTASLGWAGVTCGF